MGAKRARKRCNERIRGEPTTFPGGDTRPAESVAPGLPGARASPVRAAGRGARRTSERRPRAPRRAGTLAPPARLPVGLGSLPEGRAGWADAALRTGAQARAHRPRGRGAGGLRSRAPSPPRAVKRAFHAVQRPPTRRRNCRLRPRRRPSSLEKSIFFPFLPAEPDPERSHGERGRGGHTSAPAGEVDVPSRLSPPPPSVLEAEKATRSGLAGKAARTGVEARPRLRRRRPGPPEAPVTAPDAPGVTKAEAKRFPGEGRAARTSGQTLTPLRPPWALRPQPRRPPCPGRGRGQGEKETRLLPFVSPTRELGPLTTLTALHRDRFRGAWPARLPAWLWGLGAGHRGGRPFRGVAAQNGGHPRAETVQGPPCLRTSSSCPGVSFVLSVCLFLTFQPPPAQ